ncbi:MAG: Y-family DNA polymerase [Flavobacteriia bacterium]|nr:Y-family DNA polymerase [Flavobacteriia bacterium]
MYALVDCNNFYVSCERVFRPDLIGKPVVVLSNNDGCIISRSNEAKALGVPMGAPCFEYKSLFEQHQVKVFSANFALYGDMSHRVMQILEEYSPETEIYSIDEIFLKLDGFDYVDMVEYGKNMQQKVLRWTGIPISVGIASTKALAKVANKIAKKFPDKTQHVYHIQTDEQRIKALKWLPVGDVWGIGRQYTKKLIALGVKTAYDFTCMDTAWIKKNMAIVGVRLHRDLRGIPTLLLEQMHVSKKNIATTRSFEKNYTDWNQLRERVSTFAVSCAEKLRKQKSCCNVLMVFVHTNGHRKDLPQYSRNIVVKLPYPTNSGIELVKFVCFALGKIYKEGYAYKKAGVIVQDFTPENCVQQKVFENRNEKHIPLMNTMDKINSMYGQQKIRLAAQDLRRVWKMKQEKLSPRYTTKLSDILLIKC